MSIGVVGRFPFPPPLLYHGRMDILYEDEDYIAVNKPEHLSSVPGPGGESLLELLRKDIPGRLLPVHRLDREASGAIVFARNAGAHRHLNRMFEGREVSKTYLVLVHGRVKGPDGRIDKSIRQFGSGRMGVDQKNGKPSATEFVVKERFEAQTLVEAHPLTGRRHQLRVHFYSIGHPIAGDPGYGEKPDPAEFPRLMLHALRLGFTLPSGRPVMIEAPPPASFAAVLDRLRHARKAA